MPDEPAAADGAPLEAQTPERDLELTATIVPTANGHVQLVIDDGRTSDKAGVIIAGTPADNISARGSVRVIDQNGGTFSKQHTNDARKYLSPAGQQKVLEVLDEIRVSIGPVTLP